MSPSTTAFVEQNKDRLLEELFTFLRIPSISTLPDNKNDVERAAKFVADSLTSAGLENVEQVTQLFGFVLSAEGFGDQPKVLNGASDAGRPRWTLFTVTGLATGAVLVTLTVSVTLCPSVS